METRTKLQNFILCLLLLTLIVSGSGNIPVSADGFQTVRHEDTSLRSGASCLTAPVDFWSEQIAGSRTRVSVTAGLQNARTGTLCRSLLPFLFYVLTLLLTFSGYVRRRLALHDCRFVYRKTFIISFMQDIDGRKRILSFCR